VEEIMWYQGSFKLVLMILVAAAAVGISQAEEDRWTLKFEPIYMTAYGHDQHVLSIYENDLDGTPVSTRTGVNVSTDSGLAYRLEAQYVWNKWNRGIDFLWFVTSQSGADRTAAPSGDIDGVRFEVAGRSYTSGDPSDVLYFSLLEDHDLAMWTFDMYGSRALLQKPAGELRMQAGIRAGINSSAWWDVPVPPGAIPGPGGDAVFHENTVVLFGLQGGVEWTF
jgi:hypothetical protein